MFSQSLNHFVLLIKMNFKSFMFFKYGYLNCAIFSEKINPEIDGIIKKIADVIKSNGKQTITINVKALF